LLIPTESSTTSVVGSVAPHGGPFMTSVRSRTSRAVFGTTTPIPVCLPHPRRLGSVAPSCNQPTITYQFVGRHQVPAAATPVATVGAVRAIRGRVGADGLHQDSVAPHKSA